jgi:uncharacterized alpha-E superfamily protein
MLSRVASHLYWLARYMERAENMARILDVGQTLALLAQSKDDTETALEPLVITDHLKDFQATGMVATPESVARYLTWDPDQPSSILNCLEATRENARAVRGSITSEMWECINDVWLQLQTKRREGHDPINTEFYDWVKQCSHLFRGITFATIRRDQPYHFIRLGTFIERADNTARILSVKQSVKQSGGLEQGRSLEQGAQSSKLGSGIDSVALESEALEVNTSPGDQSDYYSLSAVLRSVSALEAYRDTYKDSIDARRVAELLVFHPTLPRSLRFCYDEIEQLLEHLPAGPSRLPRRWAAQMKARLTYGHVDEAYELGLLDFLEGFLKDNVGLGEAVQTAYLELK